MCKGKPVDANKMKIEQTKCEEKTTKAAIYSWNEVDCSCDKEKVTVVCDGETTGQIKYDRLKQKCLDRQTKDERYSWNEEKCDCLKEKDPEKENLCGEKRMSQKKYDRKKSHCDEIKGKWDTLTCKCDDPCYEEEEWKEETPETCTDTVPKLGEVEIEGLTAKICEQAIPDADQIAMKKQCKDLVDAKYNEAPDKSALQPISIDLDYTSNGKVICGDKMVSIKSEKDIERALPSNIPTTDANAYVKPDWACPNTLKADLNKYHPTAVSCDKMTNIKAGNSEILTAANEPFDEFFNKLNIQGQISAEEMNKILSTANFNLQVIGTANRSNNGTGITLDALALKRKEEAERIIKAQLLKKLQEKVIGGSYTIANPNLFTTNGLSQAVGPLNPAATLSSMHAVLAEKEAPQALKDCASDKTGKKATSTKAIFDCSVDFFVDKECPTLPSELQARFCEGDKEALKTKLKAETTVDFLADYKMFQLGVDMSTENKSPVEVDIGHIKVKCSAAITTEATTESTTTITEMLKVTKPGFFRRMKKDCREERKILNDKYGKKNVRKAANQKKNPNGVVISE